LVRPSSGFGHRVIPTTSFELITLSASVTPYTQAVVCRPPRVR
jgi:hypothetical protein